MHLLRRNIAAGRRTGLAKAVAEPVTAEMRIINGRSDAEPRKVLGSNANGDAQVTRDALADGLLPVLGGLIFADVCHRVTRIYMCVDIAAKPGGAIVLTGRPFIQ